MTVADATTVSGNRYLAEALAACGVSHVFMVPTIAVPAFAAMAQLGVEGVTTHAEKAAAYMADGYARAGGRVGVCMAQTVGAANLAAGLREPSMMGSPVIAVTGGRQPLTKHRHLYQEIEDFRLYEPLVKLNAEIDHVARVPDMLRQAFRVATTGAPGPVHLEVQGMIGNLLVDELEHDPRISPRVEERFTAAPAFRPAPDDDDVRRALALLAAAERPVILAGGGVRTSGAREALARLATALAIPVVTSLTGKGALDERHPLALGCMGAASRPSANRAVAEADLMLVVGSRLGSQVTDFYRLPARGTALIQLDIDPAELGRNHPNACSLLGDARAGLERLVALGQDGPDHAAWAQRARGYVTEFRVDKEPLLRSAATPIRPERLCRAITDGAPDDAVLVVDTGHAGIWAGSMIDVADTQTFLRAGGSLGWALPAAIGAKCAVGDRPVLCLTGDGGIYYHLSELETAVRHRINTVTIVNDNSSLSQDMKVFQNAFGGPGDEACERMWTFAPVDLASVAERFGCFATRVERPEDLDGAIADALACGRPAVVDVLTDVMALPDVPFGGVDFYSR